MSNNIVVRAAVFVMLLAVSVLGVSAQEVVLSGDTLVRADKVKGWFATASEVSAEGTGRYKVTSADGKVLGRLVVSSSFAKGVLGYEGPTPMLLVLTPANKIKTTMLLPNNRETPAYVRLIQAEGFFDKWNGLTPAEAATHEVDAVSGATYTSKSIIENIRKASAAISGEKATGMQEAKEAVKPADKLEKAEKAETVAVEKKKK